MPLYQREGIKLRQARRPAKSNYLIIGLSGEKQEMLMYFLQKSFSFHTLSLRAYSQQTFDYEQNKSSFPGIYFLCF